VLAKRTERERKREKTGVEIGSEEKRDGTARGGGAFLRGEPGRNDDSASGVAELLINVKRQRVALRNIICIYRGMAGRGLT